MPVRDQIQTVADNQGLAKEQKLRQIRALKSNALAKFINKGSGPVQRFRGRTVSWKGLTVTVHDCSVLPEDRLFLDVTVVRNGIVKRDQLVLVNPPILTAAGQENLAEAVLEMLERVM